MSVKDCRLLSVEQAWRSRKMCLLVLQWVTRLVKRSQSKKAYFFFVIEHREKANFKDRTIRLTRAGLGRKWLHQTPGVSGVRCSKLWRQPHHPYLSGTECRKSMTVMVKYFLDRTIKIVLHWTARLSTFSTLATQAEAKASAAVQSIDSSSTYSENKASSDTFRTIASEFYKVILQ